MRGVRENSISKHVLAQKKGQKCERGGPGRVYDGRDFQAKGTPLGGPECGRGAPKWHFQATLDQKKGQKCERGGPGRVYDGKDFRAKLTPLESPRARSNLGPRRRGLRQTPLQVRKTHAGRANPGSQGRGLIWVCVAAGYDRPPTGAEKKHAGRANPGSQGRGLIWVGVGPHDDRPPTAAKNPRRASKSRLPGARSNLGRPPWSAQEAQNARGVLQNSISRPS